MSLRSVRGRDAKPRRYFNTEIVIKIDRTASHLFPSAFFFSFTLGSRRLWRFNNFFFSACLLHNMDFLRHIFTLFIQEGDGEKLKRTMMIITLKNRV